MSNTWSFNDISPRPFFWLMEIPWPPIKLTAVDGLLRRGSPASAGVRLRCPRRVSRGTPLLLGRVALVYAGLDVVLDGRRGGRVKLINLINEVRVGCYGVRALSDVLLIHAPVFPDADAGPNLAMRTGIPGTGMLHIGAYLQTHGYDPVLFDVPAYYSLGLSNDDVQRKLRAYDPRVVGVELNWLQYSAGAVEAARWCRDLFPNAVIVLGGIHATLFADEIVQRYPSTVDGVLRGEAELSFLKLVEAVERGASLDAVPGFHGRVGDRLVSNAPAYLDDLDAVPPYTFDFVVPKDFLPLMHFANVNVCRGKCAWGCAYCIAHRDSGMPHRARFAVHSVEWIVDQIRILMKNKPLAIATQDLDMVFTTWPGSDTFLDHLCQALVREGIYDELTSFNITAVPGTLTRHQLTQLARAGVLDIDWGCETGAPTAARLVRRPVSATQIVDSVKQTWAAGILPKTFWMTGFPGERKEDLSTTIRLIAQTIDVGGIPRWVTPVIAIPLTDMYEHPDRYQITLRMRSFADFMAFSTTRLRRNAEYPELITHETAHLSVRDIIRFSTILREFILVNKRRVLDVMRREGANFVSLHPLWSMQKLLDDVDLAFQNVAYGYF